MQKLLSGLPNKNLSIAVSGGPDSMAVLDFVSRTRKVSAIIVDHNTGMHQKALPVIEEYLSKSNRKITLIIKKIDGDPPRGESKENFWRDKRLEFFHSQETPIITAHHLDDCIETWFWSASHGKPRVIPYQNRNIIRPFLLFRKEELVKWCEDRNISYVVDPTNNTDQNMRGILRTQVIPGLLKVNPGLHKTIARIVVNDYAERQAETCQKV